MAHKQLPSPTRLPRKPPIPQGHVQTHGFEETDRFHGIVAIQHTSRLLSDICEFAKLFKPPVDPFLDFGQGFHSLVPFENQRVLGLPVFLNRYGFIDRQRQQSLLSLLALVNLATKLFLLCFDRLGVFDLLSVKHRMKLRRETVGDRHEADRLGDLPMEFFLAGVWRRCGVTAGGLIVLERPPVVA